MNRKIQIGVSAALVLGASALVYAQSRGGEQPAAEQAMEGHDHAAMMAGADEGQPVRLDAEASRRIGVAFAVVERKELSPVVNALGTIAYDETRLTTVNPKVDGWVERLEVDFTGAPVRKGQVLLEVYSPKLVTAQEELILARRLHDETEDGGGHRVHENADALVESARRRLQYWDISDEVIGQIEDDGRVRRTLTLRSPATGVVVEKSVAEGDRIAPGMTLYRIADLSTVWIEADVFEKDLGLVREGQQATIRLEAYPGRSFTGRVTYVYPTVSVQSRTGRIRVELANPDALLKPGMYGHIDLTVERTEPALVIPRSALLSTGQRSVVFVEAADGRLMPREVTSGRVVGREVEILAGLDEGDRVVSSASFLIDAESNLGTAMDEMADPAMDPPAGDMGHEGHDTVDHSGHSPTH